MCGIGGIINIESSPFDKRSFETIGVLNDERGGDSCGIFIDNYKSIGLGKISLFRDFTISQEYPTESKINLVHCRKTSTGLNTNEFQCQPVVISNEEGTPLFVLMHNGTIHNKASLATKYIPDIDVKDMSDSQIMAYIFFNGKYEALSEYTGTAAFCIVDYRTAEPTVMFFSGDSWYNSKTEDYDVERQLYYITQDNRFIFSSISSSLYLIDNTAQINKFPTNKLLQLVNNELVVIKEYPRSKSYNYSTYNNDNYSNIYSGYSSVYVRYNSLEHKYYSEGKPLHGIYNIYSSGYIAASLFGTAKTYAFYDGYLLLSPAHYTMLEFYEKQLGGKEYLYTFLEEIVDYCKYEPSFSGSCILTIDDSFEYTKIDDVEYISFFPERINTKMTSKFAFDPFEVVYKDFLNQCAQKKLSIIDLTTSANLILQNYGYQTTSENS